MTRGDQFIGWGYIVPAVAIFGIVVFVVGAVIDARRNASADARMDEVAAELRERWGWRNLWGQPAPQHRVKPASVVEANASDVPARHRRRWQWPNPLEFLAAHGALREPAGYGPPPPIAPGPPPVRLSWAIADVNTPQFPVNASARASVPSQDPLDAALTVGQVLADTNLRGHVRQPSSMDATQRIEPIRAEVVQ